MDTLNEARSEPAEPLDPMWAIGGAQPCFHGIVTCGYESPLVYKASKFLDFWLAFRILQSTVNANWITLSRIQTKD